MTPHCIKKNSVSTDLGGKFAHVRLRLLKSNAYMMKVDDDDVEITE